MSNTRKKEVINHLVTIIQSNPKLIRIAIINQVNLHKEKMPVIKPKAKYPIKINEEKRNIINQHEHKRRLYKRKNNCHPRIH